GLDHARAALRRGPGRRLDRPALRRPHQAGSARRDPAWHLPGPRRHRAGRALQVVATAAGDWKWSEDLTFLGRFRLAHTEQLAEDATATTPATSSSTGARFIEATAGW